MFYTAKANTFFSFTFIIFRFCPHTLRYFNKSFQLFTVALFTKGFAHIPMLNI